MDFLNVNFPASSPWVTAVGGTNLHLTAQNAIASEVVWNDTDLSPGSAGGGGASDPVRRAPPTRPAPSPRPSAPLPDVAMLADVAPGYAVFCTASDCVNGAPSPWQSVGGTSAATPLLAGGVALVDQLMRQHERADIGQLNPLLYRIGRSSLVSRAFHDVTQYGNDVGPYIPGNGQPLGCCTAAPASTQASGWGSVNLSALASRRAAAAAAGGQREAVAAAPPEAGRPPPDPRHGLVLGAVRARRLRRDLDQPRHAVQRRVEGLPAEVGGPQDGRGEVLGLAARQAAQGAGAPPS